MSEHKSVKICVARRLKTCQDLQASTDTIYFCDTDDIVADGLVVIKSGISSVKSA